MNPSTLTDRAARSARALWEMRIASGAVLLAAVAALLCPGAAEATLNPCANAPACQAEGPLRAQVVKVNVTRKDAVTAYQGVRTTVRFTNLGTEPLILGYRDHSSRVSDDKGLAYRWSSKADGIGTVGRGVADAQFRLAPGESRDASFEGVLQYSMRREVAGAVFTHDITVVRLQPVDGQRLRESGDIALSFSNLTATSGYGAGAAAAAIGNGGVASPSIGAGATPLPSIGAPSLGSATAPASADVCAGNPRCQAQGPLVASVEKVNVTDSGGVTAYRTVRTTLRLRNASDQPLILGYKVGTASLTDDSGHAYNRGRSSLSEAAYVHGIGEVSNGAADPQLQLAPGEARDASFDRVLQYSSRHDSPGTVFSFDVTIAQLVIVGPRQVRSQHDYALTFSGLTASTGFGAPAAGNGPAQAVQSVGKLVELFKGVKK